MSRRASSPRGSSRRTAGLDRLAIATAGLAIADAEGLSAMSLRKVAADLGVGTMTLYRYVPSRGALVSDIVALLLDEVDTSAVEGETWEETIRRVAHSVRAMALRHPNAFPAVATARLDVPPVLDYAKRIMRLHAAQGIPEHDFVRSWGVVDAFITGFLLEETTRLVDRRDDVPAPFRAEPDALAAKMSTVLSDKSFDEALDVVIAGLRSVFPPFAHPAAPAVDPGTSADSGEEACADRGASPGRAASGPGLKERSRGSAPHGVRPAELLKD